MNTIIDIIKQADIQALLREGDTAIRTTINSRDFLIKLFIREGEVIGVNGYLSDFKRIWHNTVYVKGT